VDSLSRDVEEKILSIQMRTVADLKRLEWIDKSVWDGSCRYFEVRRDSSSLVSSANGVIYRHI
jgi:hypothetical protein